MRKDIDKREVSPSLLFVFVKWLRSCPGLGDDDGRVGGGGEGVSAS
jgi:hypothetical protein